MQNRTAPSRPSRWLAKTSACAITLCTALVRLTAAVSPDAPTGPATAPATRPAGTATLADGAVAYAPPAGWEPVAAQKTPTRDALAAPTRDGLVLIEVLPPDAEVLPGMGPAIVKKLREERTAHHQKMVMEPKVEADARFALRVHEKYEVTGSHGVRVADQLRVYRKVGPRLVLVTVNTLAQDADTAKAALAAGESAALSAEYVKPAGKTEPAAPSGKAPRR